MNSITLSQTKVSDIVDVIHDLIGMMEPYYSQSNASVDAYKMIDELELHLPYKQVIEPTNVCPFCEQEIDSDAPYYHPKKKIFNTASFRQHMHAKHNITKISAVTMNKVINGSEVIWETKQAFLDANIVVD